LHSPKHRRKESIGGLKVRGFASHIGMGELTAHQSFSIDFKTPARKTGKGFEG
jgi:hypothetical protein